VASFLTRRRWTVAYGAWLVVLCLGAAHAEGGGKFRFTPKQAAGYTQVPPTAVYSKETGFGFEPGYPPGDKPFFFSVDVPEGNYRVTVKFGDVGDLSRPRRSTLITAMMGTGNFSMFSAGLDHGASSFQRR